MKPDEAAPVDAHLTLLTLAWICLVLGGLAMMMEYGAAPGEAGLPPARWPTASTLAHQAQRQHLLIFVHPKCPCTRATRRQLEQVLTHVRAGVRVQAVVFAPPIDAAQWSESGLVQDLRSMPGLTVVLDKNGAETRRFDVHTSGHILLYDADGRLTFSGGITPARGHEGACAGLEGLIARVRGQEAGADRSPVYGCPIFDPHAPTDGGPPCRCKP